MGNVLGFTLMSANKKKHAARVVLLGRGKATLSSFEKGSSYNT